MIAVFVAEVVGYYCFRLVDIYNYSAVNGFVQKIYNWSILNSR